MKCPQCHTDNCCYSEHRELWYCPYCDWVDGREKKVKTKQRGGKKKKQTVREQWRLACMDRDGYACVMCGRSNCLLNVHHIIDRHECEDGGYTLDNGITLCSSNKDTDTNNCHFKAEQLHATGTAYPGFSQSDLRARINVKSARSLVEETDDE